MRKPAMELRIHTGATPFQIMEGLWTEDSHLHNQKPTNHVNSCYTLKCLIQIRKILFT
jgi:hypothetical protein